MAIFFLFCLAELRSILLPTMSVLLCKQERFVLCLLEEEGAVAEQSERD